MYIYTYMYKQCTRETYRLQGLLRTHFIRTHPPPPLTFPTHALMRPRATHVVSSAGVMERHTALNIVSSANGEINPSYINLKNVKTVCRGGRAKLPHFFFPPPPSATRNL